MDRKHIATIELNDGNSDISVEVSNEYGVVLVISDEDMGETNLDFNKKQYEAFMSACITAYNEKFAPTN